MLQVICGSIGDVLIQRQSAIRIVNVASIAFRYIIMARMCTWWGPDPEGALRLRIIFGWATPLAEGSGMMCAYWTSTQKALFHWFMTEVSGWKVARRTHKLGRTCSSTLPCISRKISPRGWCRGRLSFQTLAALASTCVCLG
jgi:hypothetical protein